MSSKKSIFLSIIFLLNLIISPAFAEVTEMTRISVNPSTGVQGNNHSTFSQIGKSPAGNFAVFHSNANNLVTTDTNGKTDVFVANATSGNSVELISVSTAGVQGNNYSMYPTISDDSNFIAFHSKATNLIAGETSSGTQHIYLRDRKAGTTIRISVNTQGSRTYAANQFPSISGDGRYIAYQAYAYDTGTGNGNDRVEILVYDRVAGTTTLVSKPLAGQTQTNADSSLPRISNDGKFVAFYSGASNLVSGDSNGEADVFLASTTNAVPVERISVSTAGVQGNGRSYVDGDFSGEIDGEANASPKESNALAPGISSDGRYVVFPSFSNNLTSGDTNGKADIFLRDRTSGTTTLISKKSDGSQSNANSFMPAISPDGKYISFTSIGNLVAADNNGQQADVYVYEAGASAGKKLRLISAAKTGVVGNKHSLAGSFNSSNKYISLHSVASNLVSGDTNNDSDVFFTINDTCQSDPDKTEPGICGCGKVDVDANGDGICDPVVSTYTVSGTVKTLGGTGISGVLVTYTGGGATTTVQTGASGTYSFTRNSGESYTVTPSKSGYTFAPASKSGTLTANVVQDFTGTAVVVTYTISGTVKTLDGTGISGVLVTYTGGGATTTVQTGASGTYSFTRNSGESYTVTPSKSGYTFAPASKSGTLTANVVQDFTGTLQTYTVSGTVKTSLGVGIAGIEIYYNSEIGNDTFVNTDASGAFSFPNRPYGEGYILLVTGFGYTYAPSQANGTVTGNINIPFIATPRNYTVSGTVKTSLGVGISGVEALYQTGGGATFTVMTGASGAFSFANRPYGETYTLIATKPGYTFSPVTYDGTVTGNIVRNFVGTLSTYTVSGTVKTSGGTGISGVEALYQTGGGATFTVMTGASGAFSFANRPYGETYTLIATKPGYTFLPVTYEGTVTGNTVRNFIGTLQTYTLSGTVKTSVGTGISGIAMEYLAGGVIHRVWTDAAGAYSYSGKPYGDSYVLAPKSTSYTYSPVSKSGTLTGNVVQNFVATPTVVDNCPADPLKTEPGICGCGKVDVDADHDNVCDAPTGPDTCPNDPLKTTPGICGCGTADTDSDNDGTLDCQEEECSGTCDVNNPEFDEDGDGVSNCQEIEDRTDACDDGSFKERLKPTACAGVNGFLAQANIATVVNQLSTPLRFDVQYRNQFGQLAGQVNFSLQAFQKRDLIINSMGLEPDTYGTVCVETTALTDGAWSGGITIYKPKFSGANLDEFGNSTVFDYALNIPFSNPISRAIRMPLNTNTVGNVGGEQIVSNWVQLTDAVVADGIPLRGRLVFYDINGEVMQDKQVKLEDGGRYDYPGHDAIGKNRLGAVEFIPKSQNDKFYFVLIRYYPENEMDFLSAFVMPIVFPSGAERNGRLSTLSDEVSVIEVINAKSLEVKTSQSAFGTTGQAIYSDKAIKIAGKGSAHTIINSGVLGVNTIGSASVSGPRESVTETTIVYRLNDAGALDLAYSLPFVESAGEVQFSDFNSFIGHKNYVEVTNTADTKADNAVVNVVDTSGNLIDSIDVSLDPNQAKRFELDIPGDKVGTIMLDSGDDEGLVLRSFVEKEGQYVIPQTGR